MRQRRTELRRLQRELERRQQARGGRPQIDMIEVYNGDELVEVMPLPYRVYTVDDAGRRVFVEPGEGERALEEWARRLVRGRTFSGRTPSAGRGDNSQE